MSNTTIRNPLADIQLVTIEENGIEEVGIILTMKGDSGDSIEVELTNRVCIDTIVNGVQWMGAMSDVLFDHGLDEAVTFSEQLTQGEDEMKFTDAFYKYLEDK